MSRRAATFLRAFAGWTVFVWVVFIRNITRDRTHDFAFKAVHVGLAIVSLTFAVATFVVVARERANGASATSPRGWARRRQDAAPR